LARIAEGLHATSAQVALAWLLAQKPWIVPIPGTTKRARLDENSASVALQISASDLASIDAMIGAVEISGARYNEGLQRMVDV
jgi:aryl-alcohol dehydrogenase-like predicted oxidoreductase